MIPAETAARWHADMVRHYSNCGAATIDRERSDRLARIDHLERMVAFDQLRTLACTADAPYATREVMLKLANVHQPWVTLSNGPCPDYVLAGLADKIDWERITIAALDSIA